MYNTIDNKKNIIDIKLIDRSNWDICLCDKFHSELNVQNGLQENCLISYIDINNPNCVWFDNLYSLPNYTWNESINNGISNRFIGYTGVDNGFISYKKDRISNSEFYNLYTNSILNITPNDKRFFLHKVNGNNMIYNYSNKIVVKDGILCAQLNGGFYQGFYQLYKEDYKVLPSDMNNTTFEITLMPSIVSEKHDLILNDVHPYNKGMFLYIGIRAENKWNILYDKNKIFEKINNNYVENEYVSNDYVDKENLNDDYIKPYELRYVSDDSIKDEYVDIHKSAYVKGNYVKKQYIEPQCNICEMYVKDGYLKKDKELNENENQYTSEGYDFHDFDIEEIPTNNKFIFFNNTKDGFNINTWNDKYQYILTTHKKNITDNYFLLFHNGKDGYNIEDIEKLKEKEKPKYDVLSDLYNNAISFQIRDDGSIGYKYLIKDCHSDCGYKIESEFSYKKKISFDMWSTVTITIKQVSLSNMVIHIYVNGKLALISKELPLLNIRELNDLKDKQIGVPFNISIGGGTQGLCDVIYMNYRKLPSYIYPIEKEFAGSFIGYIKDFKLYNCVLNINQINENVNFEKVSFSN